MQHTPRPTVVVTLLGAELAAVAALQRLGRVAGFALPHHGVAQWALHASTEDLFAVAARLLALGLDWWLLAATVLSIARRIVPGLRRVPTLDSFTPALLRRTLDRALAVGLGASLGLASLHPAGAAVSRRDEPVVRSPSAATTSARPATDDVVVRAAPHASAPAHSRPVPPRSDDFVIVRAGDNLWMIARRAVGDRDTEVVPYWHRVIAANAATLRSHDPNLIFPGERIALPPASG
jgi:hypothetical protein